MSGEGSQVGWLSDKTVDQGGDGSVCWVGWK